MQIRRASLADIPAIQTFIAETYGTTAPFKGPDRWNWQFTDTPFCPTGDSGPTVWVAEAGHRIVGQIAVQDAWLWLGDQRTDASWIVDVMVHPEHRGQGLGHLIHERVEADRATLVTLTMAPATRRMAERANCITLGETRQYVLPVGLSGTTVSRYLAYKTSGRRWWDPVGKIFNATRIGPGLVGLGLGGAARIASFPNRQAPLADFEVDEVETFPAEIDAFWDTVKAAFPAIFVRTKRFLDWRFGDCPDLDYRRFVLRSGGRMRGYLVTRKGEPAELPLGVVVDFFAHPEDAAALDTLLSLAREVLAPECEYLEAAASTGPFCQALARAGFLPARRFRPTVVTSNDLIRELAQEHRDHWHFTKADHDWDQVHPI